MEHGDPMVFGLAVFMLASFVGYCVGLSITPALQTASMAVTHGGAVVHEGVWG